MKVRQHNNHVAPSAVHHHEWRRALSCMVLYAKNGFKEYGINPRAFKLKDGTYCDEIIMANIF